MHRAFYVNHARKTTTWDRPSSREASSQQQQQNKTKDVSLGPQPVVYDDSDTEVASLGYPTDGKRLFRQPSFLKHTAASSPSLKSVNNADRSAEPGEVPQESVEPTLSKVNTAHIDVQDILSDVAQEHINQLSITITTLRQDNHELENQVAALRGMFFKFSVPFAPPVNESRTESKRTLEEEVMGQQALAYVDCAKLTSCCKRLRAALGSGPELTQALNDMDGVIGQLQDDLPSNSPFMTASRRDWADAFKIMARSSSSTEEPPAKRARMLPRYSL